MGKKTQSPRLKRDNCLAENIKHKLIKDIKLVMINKLTDTIRISNNIPFAADNIHHL